MTSVEQTMSLFDIVRLIAFGLGTVGIVTVSWRTLFKLRSHGFFRFVAWEAILILMLLNLPQWFHHPFSIRQIVSWVFLIASAIVLWLGVSLLRKSKVAEDRTESELYSFEKTSQLVTSGVYKYIRHPLYASLLYLAVGSFLKDISLGSSVAFSIASLSLFETAFADERECVQYFGSQYREYMKNTKRFIPFFF